MSNIGRLTSPDKTASRRQEGGGIYIGVVESVQGKTLYIKIPAISPTFIFGPCRTSWSFWTTSGSPGSSGATLTTNDSTIDLRSSHDPCPPSCPQDHVHTIAKIGESGDEVFCAFLADELDEVVVLGIVAK